MAAKARDSTRTRRSPFIGKGKGKGNAGESATVVAIATKGGRNRDTIQRSHSGGPRTPTLSRSRLVRRARHRRTPIGRREASTPPWTSREQPLGIGEGADQGAYTRSVQHHSGVRKHPHGDSSRESAQIQGYTNLPRAVYGTHRGDKSVALNRRAWTSGGKATRANQNARPHTPRPFGGRTAAWTTNADCLVQPE